MPETLLRKSASALNMLGTQSKCHSTIAKQSTIPSSNSTRLRDVIAGGGKLIGCRKCSRLVLNGGSDFSVIRLSSGSLGDGTKPQLSQQGSILPQLSERARK